MKVIIVKKQSANHHRRARKSSPAEWEADLRAYLDQNEGSLTGSQMDMAKKLNMPVRSFKLLLARIRVGEIKGILVAVNGVGRKAETTIKIENS